MKMSIQRLSFVMAGLLAAAPALAAEIRIFSTGASKAIIEQLSASFEKKTGHKVIITSDTAGGVARRVEAGEPFEVAVATGSVVNALIEKGKLAPGSRIDIASTSIGVGVKEGAPKPDISTVDAIKKLLIEAKTISYVDPASGGTSGIYFAKLIDQWGLTEQLKPKLRLQAGGYVAERVAKGESEVVFHQISEIIPVKGVTLLGGLPPEIQLVTTYSGGLAPNASDVAKALHAHFIGPDAEAIIKGAGMVQPKR
ncbi:MAG: substrate-binding domain-containing protein [Beijerinckiaceae bacterium]|nr:substrate-binding domain-containing protein [Beijerinckiaceae bacterium]